MVNSKKGLDKRNEKINNKGEGQNHQHSGYPTLVTKVGAIFPKIPVMSHYQSVNQNLWLNQVLKNRKNNVSKSSLSQHVMCFPNVAGIYGDL